MCQSTCQPDLATSASVAGEAGPAAAGLHSTVQMAFRQSSLQAPKCPLALLLTLSSTKRSRSCLQQQQQQCRQDTVRWQQSLPC
jgi:hypothetical protein